MTYTTIGTLAQRISQRSFLGLLGRGEAYQLEAPTLWDVDFQTAVAQAELEDRERPGAMHRVRFASADGGRRGADRDDPPGADPRLRGAARPPRRRAPPRARRQRGADAPVRHARAGDDPPAGRAREGHGPGDGVHVRRPHRRDVVARAAAAGALRARPRRPAAGGAVGERPAGRRRTWPGRVPATASWQGRTINQARRRIVELLAGVRRADRRARAGDAGGEVLREGRAARRDRHQPPVVHPHDRPPRRADRARPRAAAGTRRTCARASRTGCTGSPATGASAASASSACPSRSGIRSTRRARVLYEQPIAAREEQLPVDPSTDVPDGYGADQRGSPAASPATPT